MLNSFLEGIDFNVNVISRNHPVLVLAIHGGGIEPFTSDIATAIAGDDFNFYEFKGIRPANNWELHIPSTEFKDERLDSLIDKCAIAVAIHGERSRQNKLEIGGLNLALQKLITRHITVNGFPVHEPRLGLGGANISNVVNRPKLHGVQMEISRGLRKSMKESIVFSDINIFRLFVSSVRTAIYEYLACFEGQL